MQESSLWGDLGDQRVAVGTLQSAAVVAEALAIRRPAGSLHGVQLPSCRRFCCGRLSLKQHVDLLLRYPAAGREERQEQVADRWLHSCWSCALGHCWELQLRCYFLCRRFHTEVEAKFPAAGARAAIWNNASADGLVQGDCAS